MVGLAVHAFVRNALNLRNEKWKDRFHQVQRWFLWDVVRGGDKIKVENPSSFSLTTHFSGS